jgi:hypothetical protein
MKRKSLFPFQVLVKQPKGKILVNPNDVITTFDSFEEENTSLVKLDGKAVKLYEGFEKVEEKTKSVQVETEVESEPVVEENKPKRRVKKWQQETEQESYKK